MKRVSLPAVLSLVALLALVPLQAKAQNIGPPADPILDLAGQPLPSTYTEYTVSFVATNPDTVVTFAFRNDPGYTAMGGVSMTTGGGPNLIQNGNFGTGDLTDWTYDNVYGAPYGGEVSNGCVGLANFSGSSVWCDGATQAYDAIDQVVATTVGQTYTISFWLNQVDITNYSPANFQDLSTNGNPGTDGNGVDTLVYEGASIPAAAPEPASMTLVGLGLAGLGFLRRSRSKSA